MAFKIVLSSQFCFYDFDFPFSHTSNMCNSFCNGLNAILYWGEGFDGENIHIWVYEWYELCDDEDYCIFLHLTIYLRDLRVRCEKWFYWGIENVNGVKSKAWKGRNSGFFCLVLFQSSSKFFSKFQNNLKQNETIWNFWTILNHFFGSTFPGLG
jgi:hypothetical protein